MANLSRSEHPAEEDRAQGVVVGPSISGRLDVVVVDTRVVCRLRLQVDTNVVSQTDLQPVTPNLGGQMRPSEFMAVFSIGIELVVVLGQLRLRQAIT